MYFIAKIISKATVYSFFREITMLNAERIPLYGPVIFVGNHNNQFVDASMLMATIPRLIRFLIAEKSLKRPIIGFLAKGAGAIAVARPQDKAYRGLGFIDWQDEGVTVYGHKTNFCLDVHVGDKIQLLDETCLGCVEKVVSDTKLLLAQPIPFIDRQTLKQSSSEVVSNPIFRSRTCNPHVTDSLQSNSLSDDSSISEQRISNPPVAFMVIPRVDQSDVYEAATSALLSGDSIGIFPEGGSHDRLGLLPLKPGGAIMALTASLEGAEDVMIVPIGLTYYQAHKILSRATVQVGTPLRVTEDLTSLYRVDPRSAVSQLMSMIEESLRGCIISAPNYKSLMAVRVCVTLYPPESMFISSSVYHILYHQFSLLFSKNKNSPLLIKFSQELQTYTSLLSRYGIADHEVRQLKQSLEDAIHSFFELTFLFLISLIVGLIPAILWGPIRIASSYLAEQHRRKALAASKVKVTGRDVVASYKILTLMVLVPAANVVYSLLFGFFYCSTYTGYLYCLCLGLILLPCLYYYSIRYFAKIPILIRRYSFLFLVIISRLNAWRDNEKEIITSRMQMQLEVRQLVQVLGPQTGENFMSQIEICVPDVVRHADSNRIRRKLDAGDFVPLGTLFFSEGREEIL